MSRLNLDEVWADEPPKPVWLIPRIMIAGQMVNLAGDAGVGKSLLALTWCHHVAAGLPLFNEPVEAARVLYINEENSYHDIVEYLRWARFGFTDIDVSLLREHLRVEQFTLTFSSLRWYEQLRLMCDEWKPRLIVIDTATPACQIQDEDKNGEANIAIAHLRRAMAASAPGCGMLVLKHSRVVGKGDRRTIRGAKAWRGATDGTVFHTKTAGKPRSDGLHSTYLWPDKSRAFGLKERVRITPQWVQPGTKRSGILLRPFDDPDG